MSYWGNITRTLEDADPIYPNRVAAAALWRVVVADNAERADVGSTPDEVAEAACAVGQAWLVQLDQNPDASRTSLEQVTASCQEIRVARGRSTLPLRYTQVELSTVLGLKGEALEQFREARLSSPGKIDTGVVLATAHAHDDYSGVISIATATSKRIEADPVEST